jgi:hypothetical protein
MKRELINKKIVIMLELHYVCKTLLCHGIYQQNR